MSNTARDKFVKGQRVIQSDRWMAQNGQYQNGPHEATVTGFSRDGEGVLVTFDGHKHPQRWSINFWEVKQ